MADLLNTSISGLLAFQRALDTTSHNITNANTVGYSRQLPEFMTRQAQQSPEYPRHVEQHAGGDDVLDRYSASGGRGLTWP